MFSMEVRINGSLIGHIHGQNLGLSDTGETTKYSYEYYEPTLGALVKGTIYHVRELGIRPLLQQILQDISVRVRTRGLPKDTKVEAVSLSLPRWRTPAGVPTCCVRSPEQTCPFLRTDRAGSLETCALSVGKAGETALSRSESTQAPSGKGYLIPGVDCVVWSAEERWAAIPLKRKGKQRAKKAKTSEASG